MVTGIVGTLLMVAGGVMAVSAATTAIHAKIGHVREDVRAFVQQVEAQRVAVTRPPLLT